MSDQLFESFLQAGFECSTHKTKSGKRLDLVASTAHDQLVAKDYERMRQFGMRTAREGTRWHLIERTPGAFDFSSIAPFLKAAQTHDIQIVWDLLHFGWPDHLDVFSSEWLDAFHRFARSFAAFVRSNSRAALFVAPVNEISFVAWAGGDAAAINPFQKGRGADLKRQLVGAYLGAARAIREEVPDARIVSPEPVIHIIGNPKRPKDVKQAEEYRLAMFESWDMIAGKSQPELGGDPRYLDILGLNYYDKNQWWNRGKTIRRGDPEYRPFREIIQEVYDRYSRPLFIAETGTEDEERPGWFAYICDEVRAALAAGVDINGICLYPILNHPGWEDDRHCHNGLWDYPEADGSRAVYQPLADEIRRQNELGWKKSNGPIYTKTQHGAEGGPRLLFSSPLELRLPASATPDEPLRTATQGVLRRGANLRRGQLARGAHLDLS